jgi:hypothetical protein
MEQYLSFEAKPFIQTNKKKFYQIINSIQRFNLFSGYIRSTITTELRPLINEEN